MEIKFFLIYIYSSAFGAEFFEQFILNLFFEMQFLKRKMHFSILEGDKIVYRRLD